MARTPRLGVELCFRPNPSVAAWVGVLRVVRAWEPRLQPSRVDRLADGDRRGPEPWSEEKWDELARLCAGEAPRAWTLLDDRAALEASREALQVRLSLVVPPPDEEPVVWLDRLLSSLEGLPRPAMAMVLDRDSREDGALIMQGLDRLVDVPPIFYLDRLAMATLGGLERMRAAPAEVREAPGGLLFVVRPSLWTRPRGDERKRIQAMRQFLWLSPDHPLSLTGEEHLATVTGEPAWSLVQWWPEGVEGKPSIAGGCGAGKEAWAVGAAGTVVHWDGESWGAVDAGCDRSLAAVWDAEGGDLWAVGEGGTLLRWDGEAWSQPPSPTRRALHGAWGNAPDRVFAVGDAGTILGWDGRAWSAMPSATEQALFGISGTGDEAWAVGAAGTIVHWDGRAWSLAASPTGTTLHGVCSIAPGEAWAVGLGGTLLRLRGESWSTVDSGTNADLRSVWARSDGDVWVAGDGFTLRHWNGAGWTQLQSDTRERLMQVWGAGQDEAWVVGSDTLILRIAPGADR